jgi:hypothetical protein
MKSRFLFVLIFSACLFSAAQLFAQDSASPGIQWTGMASLVEGQFIKCKYYQDDGNGTMPFRPWVTNEYARLGIKAVINRHLSMIIIPQLKLWNDTWDWEKMNSEGAASNPFCQHATFSLADAEGIFSFDIGDAAVFNIATGVMPYKYDYEAKNLGEYLFRTGEHPAYILGSFDEAYATLTGLKINAEIFKNFSMDLLFTTETQVQPINDWSLSFLVKYKLPQYIDAGAGVMFDRMFHAVELLDKNSAGGTNTYYTSTGRLDTFCWGGTKVMAHLSIDPKGFLPEDIANIFGKEDGKIYGEAAILGVKNINAYMYPEDPNTGMPDTTQLVVIDSSKNYYSDISERIPIMLGFNVPTCKILDYLSAELEWYGWPYSSSIYDYEKFQYLLPRPKGVSSASHWKYSFNLKKTFWERVSIIGQIARDHTRHDVYYNGNTDVMEVFQDNSDWGWWLKLQFNF